MEKPIETNKDVEKMDSRLKPMLERGCRVKLEERWLVPKECFKWEKRILQNADLKAETGKLMGKTYVAKRKTCYYGTASYSYAGTRREPQAWPDWILPLKSMVEDSCGCTFNFLLINHYPDGNAGLGYHSDDEKDLDPNSTIASLSLGCSRDFYFKHKTDKKLDVVKMELHAGTLFTMDANVTQKNWKHCIPVRKGKTTGRLNLTFRTMKER
jgi:alkylated DNA repair dioxygenase AlkB